MSVQSGGQRLRLSTLNEHLTCKLCGGYYIDATTIIECLHSFCKSCIVKYLENNKFCPICDAQVHKNKPLLNIRQDQMLQDIVYKLVPGCYQNEMRFRKEFYNKHPEEKDNVFSSEAKGEPIESYIYSPDESLSLSLEYYSPKLISDEEDDKETASKPLPRRYLRCPAAVTVFHLQKLIRAKYGLSEAHKVDIMYKEESLCTSYTLMDIMYIYHWRRKVPLHLSYRIFESSSKRLKLSEDNDEFKQSLSNSNIKFESKDDELLKREWKEVQLKISETGVMSVTDISTLDTKKSTKVNEINQQSNLEQRASNNCNVNKKVVKTEDKEVLKSSCTVLSKNKNIQPDNVINKIEQMLEEKPSTILLSVMSTPPNVSKSEEMELKSIDQHDLSNELLKPGNEIREINSSKIMKDSCQTSNIGEQIKIDNKQQSPEKKKMESLNTNNKYTDIKQTVTHNNFINSEIKLDPTTKQCIKLNDTKIIPSAGSKINALSAKLQFQPKIGQVNNTYSKKPTITDKKIVSSPIKARDVKITKTSSKPDTKVTSDISLNNPSLQTSDPKVSIGSLSCSITNAAVTFSQSNLINTSVTVPLVSSNSSPLQPLDVPTSESLASIGLHVSTTMSSQGGLRGWITDQGVSLNKAKVSIGKDMSSDQQLRSLPGLPQISKDIVCSTTSGSSTGSMGRFSIQTPSMSIYSITTSTKNNLYTNTTHNYTSPTKQPSTKSSLEVTSMYSVPPCPDAIPISLMKPVNAKKDLVSKGTTLNEICAKISGVGTGSKINDICAKIGENSKEKNKIEAQRNKPDIPDLLKISKKNSAPTSETLVPVKHIPNIPNVPIYTPSNSQSLQSGIESKDAIKRLSASITPSQTVIMSSQIHKGSTQKKHSQAVGYKTLRDPPKSWNPTLSKNNYVAAKNQAKEFQNQSQGSYGSTADGSTVSKQIPSKPAKIFKIRNMPRYLGNPASGVKPMYGVTNDQSKEKDQSSCGTKTSSTMGMMKIDPQTLSPIVSSSNSPIVSPPPYSPTARGYQNSPYGRDICRNSTSSPISPRNSPVNMLSTNPFIPSHTPNTNPRLIYSHFPPGFTDASRFSNPLIRSPIGIPPPSAFHSSLPPSINNLYQRSGYMAQPQTSIAGFSPGSTGQPPTVQRIPPSSHVSTLPKTSITSPTVSSINLTRSEQLQSQVQPSITTTTSSIVDNVALQLAKGLTKREVDLFDLTRSENFKSNTETVQQTSQLSHGSVNKVGENSVKSKSSPTVESQKPVTDVTPKQNDVDVDVKELIVPATAKEIDKREKNLAKVNGGIATPVSSGEKVKDVGHDLQRQSKDTKDSIKSPLCSLTSSTSSSPSKVVPCKSEITQKESSELGVKQLSDAQEKLETEVLDSKSTVQSKNSTVEAVKKEAET